MLVSSPLVKAFQGIEPHLFLKIHYASIFFPVLTCLFFSTATRMNFVEYPAAVASDREERTSQKAD
jgi:hypothetical protein